jgi:hypothetical protein
MKSYSTHRQQVVKIDQTYSSMMNVVSDTPQGRVLSGFFFKLYINSIARLELDGQISLYCADKSLVNAASVSLSFKAQIESDLTRMNEWLKYHYMTPNCTRAKYVQFDTFINVSISKISCKTEQVFLFSLSKEYTTYFTTNCHQSLQLLLLMNIFWCVVPFNVLSTSFKEKCQVYFPTNHDSAPNLPYLGNRKVSGLSLFVFKISKGIQTNNLPFAKKYEDANTKHCAQ